MCSQARRHQRWLRVAAKREKPNTRRNRMLAQDVELADRDAGGILRRGLLHRWIHDAAPESGYRLVADELPEHGIAAGETRVQRICSVQRIWSLHSNQRGLDRRPAPAVRRRTPHDARPNVW